MAEYADPFPNKDWSKVSKGTPMAEPRRKYTSVSLEPEAVAQLHLAQGWLSGERGQVTTLSETVAQLVDWYAEARGTLKPGHLAHTKQNPHTPEDCDTCNYNAYLDRREGSQ